MPRKPSGAPSGVVIKDAHIQIDLRTVGFGRERLELPPTPVNLRYAEKLRNEILGKIERGTFVLADYFPESTRIAKHAPSMTFMELGKEWLKVRTPELQHSTVDHYKQTLNSYHFEKWNEMALDQFDFRTTKGLLAALPAHPKTFNNIATVIRQAFEYGHSAKLLREPVHKLVEMRKRQAPAPDPFTLKEVDLLLSHMPEGKSRDYYEFAFFSGLRPSEQIAMKRRKFDQRRQVLLVDEALTRGQVKGTKTMNTREVELLDRALSALLRQLQRELSNELVWTDDDGNPLDTTDTPLRAWWKPAMKASGLRARDARQTRHTFATMGLMGGGKPGWLARNMGHSVEMFFRVYSKWIVGADEGAERRKLDAFVAQATGTKTGTNLPN